MHAADLSKHPGVVPLLTLARFYEMWESAAQVQQPLGSTLTEENTTKLNHIVAALREFSPQLPKRSESLEQLLKTVAEGSSRGGFCLLS